MSTRYITRLVEERVAYRYVCDKCGAESDEHPGCGGSAALPYGWSCFNLHHRVSKTETWLFCDGCAESVSDLLNGLKAK